MIFVPWGFHIKNVQKSDVLLCFNSFLNLWHMPLLFMLSGIGTWYALNFRKPGEYVKERVLRLFVPLIFGMFVIVPPQTYVERLQKNHFKGSYLDFLSHLFNGFYPDGNITWNHLWFMVYLFLFSVIGISFFRIMKLDKSVPGLERLSNWFGKGPRIFLGCLPFSIAQIALITGWPNGDQNLIGDLDNFSLHFLIFVFGFMACTGEGYFNAFSKNKLIALIIAVPCSAVLISGEFIEIKRNTLGLIVGLTYLGLRGLCTWCWLIVFLGYAREYLNIKNRFLVYAAEAALPFYILHQTVILLIGYNVVKFGWGVPAKFLLIVVSAFIGTIAIYDTLVKRISILRFLFGMRPKARATKLRS